VSAERFDWRGITSRGLFSLFFVFSVWNPSGYSYVHWVVSGFDWIFAKLCVGLVILFTFHFVWTAVYGVLRWRGINLIVGISATGTVAAGSILGFGVFSLGSLAVWALGTLAAVFTAGLSYSALQHRIGGITHTEEIAH
jgi:hypothetical protein